MTREEQIHKTTNTISTNIGKDVDEDYICNDEYDFTIGFECGAKWADEHPNLYNDEKYHTVQVSCLDELYRKAALYDAFLEKAYTKEELIKMGFTFDLNGNIKTPEECYESSIKYVKYRKHRYIDKTCEYLYQALNNGDIDVKNMELFIDNFKKIMGE